MNYVVPNSVKVFILASVFTVAASIFLIHTLPEWKLVQIPLHSVVETLGLFAGLSGAILLLLQKHDKQTSHYVGISAALVCMGLLDGFHAAVPAGNAFVWLHSMAVLSGGFLFAILWFTRHKAHTSKIHVMPVFAAVAATGIGTLTVLLPGIEPLMLREGIFTPWAVSINVLGGLLFIAGAIYFLVRNHSTQKKEDIFFAFFCSLNGFAGLFFWFSEVWNAQWWFWHVLRVLAYFILLGHIFIIFRRTEMELLETRELNVGLEQKVAERTRALIEAQQELVRKEKLAILGQLSGSVGHELRNPLGVMSNAVYFLKMVLADADEITKEYLEIIRKEIDNSLRIITDLLDFARTRPPQTKAVTVRELTDESLGRCAIPDNVDLLTEIPDNLPLLRVDPLQMGQVLTNFITNAVQAMPKGGELRVAAQLVGTGLAPAQAGCPQGAPLQDFIAIAISVTDTGEGITPENMKKLFQPLFTTKAKGIGLGLVLCRNLAEANGGRIEVESRIGEGTTFAVTLPIRERPGGNEPQGG